MSRTTDRSIRRHRGAARILVAACTAGAVLLTATAAEADSVSTARRPYLTRTLPERNEA
ncbi:hypothetical protein ABZ154_14000 [Streptomyces sp. NPDC006261]|uniref:hypothetical protein n=1 Tax=Streptomyces sp. NPDC006261 TaxID=3156739 RepID=UPI0033BDFF52